MTVTAVEIILVTHCCRNVPVSGKFGTRHMNKLQRLCLSDVLCRCLFLSSLLYQISQKWASDQRSHLMVAKISHLSCVSNGWPPSRKSRHMHNELRQFAKKKGHPQQKLSYPRFHSAHPTPSSLFCHRCETALSSAQPAAAGSESATMPRIPSAQQHFGAVISHQAASKKDLAASAELEKCLRVMGLYENDDGSRRRKVGDAACGCGCGASCTQERGGGQAGRRRVRCPSGLCYKYMSIVLCGRTNVCNFFAFFASVFPCR